MAENIILEAQHISKSFGATQALKDVSLKIRKGTIHSIVGRNGAGKSTLVNIMAGVYPQDTGEILYEGVDISGQTLKERQQAGIALVTQHASYVPDMTVAENISIGMWPRNKAGLIDWKEMRSRAVKVMEEFGLELDPDLLLRHLTPVDQRKINIIRALFGGGKFVILDEPTTSLSVEDRDNLFKFVRTHAEAGITFILISHYLEEILRVSDDITVVRDGQAFHGAMTDSNSQEELARMIAGEDVELTYRDPDKVLSDEVVLETFDLSSKYLKPTSVKVHRREIVGFVGFPGSGAREICTTMYGVEPLEGGTAKVDGKEFKIKNPEVALKNGICYLPNDRHAAGIVPIMSIKENIGLSSLKGKLNKGFGFIDSKKEISIAEHSLQALKIKAEGINALANSLSGGNQQKVVLAKVLACDPKVLILDEPTIGIDIKSREEIIAHVKELTKLDMAVIYVTNDFDELLRIIDRVVIFNNGEVVADLPNKDLTPEDIINIRDKKKKAGEQAI